MALLLEEQGHTWPQSLAIHKLESKPRKCALWHGVECLGRGKKSPRKSFATD